MSSSSTSAVSVKTTKESGFADFSTTGAKIYFFLSMRVMHRRCALNAKIYFFLSMRGMHRRMRFKAEVNDDTEKISDCIALCNSADHSFYLRRDHLVQL